MHAGRTLSSRQLVLAPLAVLVLLPLLTACGGKGSNTPAAKTAAKPPTAASMPEALWEGTLTNQDGESFKANALVLANGEARLVVPDQFMVAVKLENGKGEGHRYPIGMNDLSGKEGKVAASITVTQLTPGKKFSGQYQVGSSHGTFTFEGLGSLYNHATNHAVLSGPYKGRMETRTFKQHAEPRGYKTSMSNYFSFDIFPDGTFSAGKEGVFHAQGNFTIPDQTKGGLELAFTYTPAEGQGVVEQFKGVAVYVHNPETDKHIVWLMALGEHGGLMEGEGTRY